MYVKKCSTSLAIKKNTRFHLTPVKMATIKNTNRTNVGKDVGERRPYTLLVGM
jgi:hypothetical protein